MSRDRCSFLPGKHLNPTSCGVIRNQRSKIRRSNISSTAGRPFWKISKFECRLRVIKHARFIKWWQTFPCQIKCMPTIPPKTLLFSKLYIVIMDSQKQLKLCRFPQRTCKLMRLKVVIWILIAARSWQWAVVARNKQNFTFISFYAGTVKEYTLYSNLDYIYTPSLTREYNTIRTEPWVHAYTKRDFTLIYGALIHAYSIHESTLIQCVNLRLFDAWMHAYTER